VNKHKRAATRFIDKAEKIRDEAARRGTWRRKDQVEFDKWMSKAEDALDKADEAGPVDTIIGARSSRGFETGGGNVNVKNDWTGRDRFGEWLRGQRPDYEFRAGDQLTSSSGAGGVLVPEEFQDRVFEIAKSFDGLRRTRVSMEVTEHGRDLALPSIDDTANTAKIVTEGTTISGTTALAFTAVDSVPVTYRSGPILASWELLDDSAVDMVDMLERKMAERIGRATAQHFATRSSTNTSGPHGIATVSTGAVTMTAGSTNLTAATFRDLYFSVDPVWRNRGEWIMSDDALSAAVALEDGNGRPLVQNSLSDAVPGMLMGKRIRVVNDLESINASSNKPILFGDMSAYMIRDVKRLRLLRLEERYAEQGKIGFIAFSRHDARPLFSSTFAAANRPIRAVLTTT
jgi:HK97 family phage major capsid protein